ncbi:hypothetical protein N035_020445 [Klebsiella pneumoniae EGD-HP19-C]|nr:hypothetical protein N035_020445 [Klebsiella pneumoniae EGD-HP19-C]
MKVFFIIMHNIAINDAKIDVIVFAKFINRANKNAVVFLIISDFFTIMTI